MEKIKIKLPNLTCTDILRICVGMSGGDVSLPKVPASKVRLNAWSKVKSDNPARELFKFKKFNRSERKRILGLLEITNCDVREFVLKDNRWVRLGEILHPGEYAKQFPKAFAMFNAIRNTKVQSWYGEVDNAFKHDFDGGLKVLSERPGEFMRKMDYLVRSGNSTETVLNRFNDIAPKVSNKVLFEAYNHFDKRNKIVQNRTIMVKGARKRTALPDLPAIDTKVIKQIQNGVKDAIAQKFSILEKLGNVFIHEDLKKLPLPTNMRSMNSTLKPVMRGQRVPIGNQNAKVVRAFVHWFDERGNQDLDLSSTFIGMGKTEHIGWNGHHNTKIGCYSGDIRFRQGACAEYIDIDIKEALKAGFKYVIMDVRNYVGGGLSELKDCVFGYMEREFPKSGEIFVPKTLANSVRLQSNASTTLVCAIDLETQEYIFLDIDSSGIPVASANFDKIMESLKPYTELPAFSVYELLKIHADARGTLVDSAEKADIKLTLDEFPSYVEIGKWMGI